MPAASKKRSRAAVHPATNKPTPGQAQGKLSSKGKPEANAAEVEVEEAFLADARQVLADRDQQLRKFVAEQKAAKRQRKDMPAPKSHRETAKERKMQAEQADLELVYKKQRLFCKTERRLQELKTQGDPCWLDNSI